MFGYGAKKGDEPHYALILTTAIALSGVAVANLDQIAGLTTSFFLLNYTVVNWTCFVLSITGAPNFRPTWRCVRVCVDCVCDDDKQVRAVLEQKVSRQSSLL